MSTTSIREAILKAADHIERNPDEYYFMSGHVPAPGCKGCMLGFIGRFLGMSVGEVNNQVKRAIGFDPYGSREFYSSVQTASGNARYQDDGEGAAACLRAFVAVHFPAQPIRLPNWQEIAARQTVGTTEIDEMLRV